jgi:perosamine synthetase
MSSGAAALSRFAPGGSPIPLRALGRVLAGRDAEAELCAGLAQRVGAREVTLHASGREALRVAFAYLAERSGRREVVVPAYVCFSVPAAAVAAGLSVRLVDVDESGRIDARSLAQLPLENAAALVVANLFGVAEPLRDVLPLARAAGVALVDDAAQALGARSAEGPAGGRGELGVLSFGRAKPLSALGGGAIAWPGDPPRGVRHAPVTPRPLPAALRALAYDAVRWPAVLGVLARIPALGIGETVYDTDFTRGPVPGAALCLAHALLPELEAGNRERAQVAAELVTALRDTGFRPIAADPGATAVYPRLGVVAPSAAAREAALGALRPLGASRFYPSSLAQVVPLRAHLAGAGVHPGAEQLASRLFTLPTHAAVRAQIAAIAHRLAGLTR